MKKPNIIWILGESIRNYPGTDRFSQYPLFKKLSSEGILFENMVVTAPSTIMSQSSMLTGQPPTYLSRTFADFTYDPIQFSSLYSVLKMKGYHCYAGFYHIEGSQLFKEIMPLIKPEDLPDGIQHDIFWTSEDVNAVLDRLLQRKIEEPFFLLLNYNNQENTAEMISLAIDRLKKSPFFENSIFLFCPDHGWPDESRGDLAKKHEIDLSRSNILINFFLRYPSCRPSIVKTFTSTLDIFPTILSLLDISPVPYHLKGISLLSSIEQERTDASKEIFPQRKFRVDRRYLFQNDRAVCICDKSFKYHVSFSKWSVTSDDFFSMEDYSQSKNLITVGEYQDKIREFKEEFVKTEQELIDVQIQYLKRRCQEKLKIFFEKKDSIPNQVLVLGSAHPLFLKSIITALTALYPVKIDLAVEQGAFSKDDVSGYKNITIYDLKTKQDTFEFKKSYQKELQRPKFNQYSGKIGIVYQTVDSDDFITQYPHLCEKEYDLVVVPFDNPYGVGHQQAVQLIKKLKAKDVIYFDYNLNVKKPSHWFMEGFRRFNTRRRHYLTNPKSFLFEVKRYGYALGFLKDPTLKRKIKS